MTSKTTQTAIVKLEVIVAVTQSICTDVVSERHGVTSHTTVVFQSIAHSLYIPHSLQVGYAKALAKLCGVKILH
jgi:hypothetical protein